MFRLICAAAIFCVCAVFGAVRAESLRLRLRTAELLLGDLNSILTSLKFEKKTAKQIVSGLAAGGKLPDFWKKMTAQLDAGRSFGDAWSSIGGMLTLEKQDAETALAFAGDFGAEDIETETAKLMLALSRLGESVKCKKQDYPNKQKLAGTLSVLFGVAAALLMI